MQIRTASACSHPRSKTLLDQAGICIAAECRAAGDAGGDFYVVAPRYAGVVALVIGDVCGRGNDGAELLPTVVPTLDELCRAWLRPARLLTELDLRLRKLLPPDRFLTLAAFEIDTNQAELTVANAAHVPALIRSGDRVRVIGRSAGPPIGLGHGSLFAEDRVKLANGDVLVLMTDGVLEAVESDLIGMSDLRKLVANAPSDAESIHRAITSKLDSLVPGRALDDMTLLVVEMAGGSGAWAFPTEGASFSCAC